MRFLFFSDVHLADTPPSMRTETYTEDIIAKLEEIAGLCKIAKVDYALFGGDWFNSKIAARVSHNLVNASLSVLDKFPCSIIFIVGSHDVPYGRLDLMYKRPIGTILRHPNVIYIDDVTTLRLQDQQHCVRLLPVSDSYNNTTEEVVAALQSQREQSDGVDSSRITYDIAMLHQPVVREGSFPYTVIQASDLVGTADLVLYGHMHEYAGVWELSVDNQTTTFVNMGAVSRGSLDEKTLARVPKVFLFEIDNNCKMSLQKEVTLKSAKPSEEVFKLAVKQEKLDRELDIETLLASVKDTQFGTFSTQSAIERIRSLSYTSRDGLLPDERDFSEKHFEVVKTVAVGLLEELDN